MNAQESETWGQLGPAMQALSERHRTFVRTLVTGKPGHGALTRAYAAAGDKSGKRTNLNKEAHRLSRDERILAAIAEESRKVIKVGYPEAVAALFALIRNPAHRDHGKAVMGLIDRLEPTMSKHVVDVTHRHEDPDRVALEELKALRQLGADRNKLLEFFGANGLDRLEALEAVETAQRSAAAKVIDVKPEHANG